MLTRRAPSRFRRLSRGLIRPFILFLALVTLLPSAAGASGSWQILTGWSALSESFSEESSDDAAFAVSDAGEYTGEITVTFLGDCTLGGEESKKNSRLGFLKRIEENGLDFPFRFLRRLTANDDLTVANLEGVLSDRKLAKEKKKYNFIGPASYTGILAEGEIECVTLANNHSHDYGDAGYADTKTALESAGIAWFGTDAPAVWTGNGVMIGFLGVNYSLTGNRYRQYEAQAQVLKDLGCNAIITVMHAGEEYSYTPPTSYQKQIVSRAVSCGSCLVVGHHPHVVQGYTLSDGIPVVYSLGNCSFGGTTHAKDSDALALQAVISFREGVPEQIDLHFYPISITSDDRYNNYSPQLLTDSEAERVLDKMRKSTGMDPGAWDDDLGAVVTVRLGGK